MLPSKCGRVLPPHLAGEFISKHPNVSHLFKERILLVLCYVLRFRVQKLRYPSGPVRAALTLHMPSGDLPIRMLPCGVPPVKRAVRYPAIHSGRGRQGTACRVITLSYMVLQGDS